MPTLEGYASDFLQPYVLKLEDRSRHLVKISDDVIAIPLFGKSRVDIYYEDDSQPFESSSGVFPLGTLYLGTSGLQLLGLSNEHQNNKDGNWKVFLEINHDIKRDTFSSAFFDIIPPGPLTAESGRVFLEHFKWIEDPFRQALDVKTPPDRFRKLVLEILDPETSLLDEAGKKLLGGVELFFSSAIAALELLNPIIANCTVDETVWNRKKRSRKWKNIFEGAAKQLDILHESIPDFKTLVKIDVQFISQSLDKINQFATGIKEIIDSLRKFIRTHLSGLNDSADTLISFFSGFWNGLVDFVSGLLGLILLVMQLANAQLAATKDIGRLTSVFSEAIDEATQAFRNIEWAKVWNHVKNEKVDELITFIKEEYTAIEAHADDVSVLGYGLGYFVFNIIENFFPPIKLTRAASAGVPMPQPIAQALKGL